LASLFEELVMMTTRTEPHHDQQAAIAALFRGRLDQAQHQALHRHLAGCPDCRRTYERYALAERALSPQAELSPLVEDRVAARLFGGAPERRPSRANAPLWAAFAAAAGLAVMVLVPKPADELTTRSGDRVSAQVNLRVLGVGKQGDELLVNDLESVAVLPGQRLQVLATSYEQDRHARAWVVLSDGRILPLGEPQLVKAGVEDQNLASVEVTPDWPAGELLVLVVYAEAAATLASPPEERSASDQPGRNVRLSRGRVAGSEAQ
jgi:hypothetical protein